MGSQALALAVQLHLALPHVELELLGRVAGGAVGHGDVLGDVPGAAQPVRQRHEPRGERSSGNGCAAPKASGDLRDHLGKVPRGGNGRVECEHMRGAMCVCGWGHVSVLIPRAWPSPPHTRSPRNETHRSTW